PFGSEVGLAIGEKFGSVGEGRKGKRLEEYVGLVNSFEPELEELANAGLRDRTDELRQRIGDGETMEDLLPEAFALVREAAKRTIGQRPFHLQVMGAGALHQGDLAEPKTGKGKTPA